MNNNIKIILIVALIINIILTLFLLSLESANALTNTLTNAGTNKDIYTQIDYKVDCIYKQYKKNKSYLNNLIITDFCVKRNFTATQITIIQKIGMY